MRNTFVTIAVALALAGAAGVSQAATLATDAMGGIMGSGGAFNNIRARTNDANNDDFAGLPGDNPNWGSFGRVYTGPDQYTLIGLPTIDDGLGATEYAYDIAVTNQTGVTWYGARLRLGYSSGADFVPALVDELISFDAPVASGQVPTVSGGLTTLVTHEAHLIEWAGGSIADGETVHFAFGLDVHDGVSTRHPGGSSIIVLSHEFVTVPEPATMSMLALGGLAVLKARRRRD